jgi:hypothetical protein
VFAGSSPITFTLPSSKAYQKSGSFPGRLDERLQEAATAAGRSLSEEIEHRVERSFQDDDQAAAMMGSHVAGEILRLVRTVMVVEGLGIGEDWIENRARAGRVRVAVNAIIAAVAGLPVELPPAEQQAEAIQTARELLIHSSMGEERLPAWLVLSNLEAPFEPEPLQESEDAS